MRDTRGVRATGLQGDASPEIIEILDDDINVFGDRAATTRGHGADNGGPRWIGPLAAAVLGGLIVYGVATSASTSSPPKAAPPPSTAPVVGPSTTTPTTSAAAAPIVPYYAANPPRQYTVQEVAIQGTAPTLAAAPAYQLWSTEGASASSGSWFSVAVQVGPPTLTVDDAYRVQAGDRSLVIAHTTGGHTVTRFGIGTSIGVTITSFGWSDPDVARLAQSVQTDGSSIAFGDSWFAADHQLVTFVSPELALKSLPAEQVTYLSSDGSTLVITVGQRLSPDAGGATFDRDSATRFLLDGATQFPVGGHLGVAGELVGSSGRSMAAWIAGGDVVTVTATLPVDPLIAVAQTVHTITEGEWDGMKFQSVRNNANHVHPFATDSHPVAQGTDPDLQQWKITEAMSQFADIPTIQWTWSDDGGHKTRATEVAQINTVVDGQRTYVLADLPHAVAVTATTELHVLPDGADPVIVPFLDVDPDLDRAFAAFAFSEPLPYTAQIVATDGTVLASWPAS